MKYRDTFLSLACVDETDRNVWLHEFLIYNEELKSLISDSEKPINYDTMRSFQPRPNSTLASLNGINNGYSLYISTINYINIKKLSKCC
jgi:hypothetical protein